MKAVNVHGGDEVLDRISEREGGVKMTAPGIKAPLVGLDLDRMVVRFQSVTDGAGLGGDSSLSGDGDGLR